MNRDDVIRMAREAGYQPLDRADFANSLEEAFFVRFAALVAAAEREACASICFQEGPSIDGELIAEAIRARGQT